MGVPKTFSSAKVVAVAVLLAVATMVVVNAPANWLARYLAYRTDGMVLLADADGTVWSGSAVMALAPPTADAAFDPAYTPAPTPAFASNPPSTSPAASSLASNAGSASALALPGRVNWTLNFERALVPVLHLTHDGVLLQPLAVRYRDGGLTLDRGSATLPASMLRLAGAPLNTLLPEGRCTLRWDALRFDGSGAPSGNGTLGVAAFALAISPVKPLGDYLLTWSSGSGGVTWQLATERGPLELQGSGSVAGRRSRVRVVVRVAKDAPAPVVARLNPLLDMFGRHTPGEAVIESGGRS